MVDLQIASSNRYAYGEAKASLEVHRQCQSIHTQQYDPSVCIQHSHKQGNQSKPPWQCTPGHFKCFLHGQSR